MDYLVSLVDQGTWIAYMYIYRGVYIRMYIYIRICMYIHIHVSIYIWTILPTAKVLAIWVLGPNPQGTPGNDRVPAGSLPLCLPPGHAPQKTASESFFFADDW